MIRVLILVGDEQFGKTLADRLRQSIELGFEVVLAMTMESARQAIVSADLPFDVLFERAGCNNWMEQPHA